MPLNWKSQIIRHAQVVLAMGLFVVSCLAATAQTTNSFFEFIQEQGKRHYTSVPHEVLAVYYVWYGYGKPGDEGWKQADTNKLETANTARFPVKGPYKSQDIEVIDWHIDQAKAHGITGFVVSWFGLAAQWHDKALALLLERAELKDFKIAVYWETHRDTADYMVKFTVDDLSYVVGHYGRSKAFLKIDGKPVIFAYGRVVHQTPVALWPEIVERVRARAGDFALIADGYQPSYANLFDGLHTYDPAGLSPEVANHLSIENLGKLRAWATDHYAKGVKLARERSRIACVMVTPGGDARKAYKVNDQTDRLDGQTYRALWDEAIKANPDWVLITSWNEWPEGTEIEPSVELGDQYLQITAEYSKRFLASAPVDVPDAAPLPQLSPGTNLKIDSILAGRNIAVLIQDRMNDSEFWAAYCGATLRRFDWPDLIDANAFNASNYPVLIHIGGEHYKSSVKATDDVVKALARYVRQGGFMVSLPTGTWPLLYDDSRKGIPHGITDMLAMGVDNGFEQPPSGVNLTFHAKTNVLFGLSPTAAFPTVGDLRWRPGSRKRVPAMDAYTSLMQLKDGGGKVYGDAVSYIEHRTPSLSGGKSLYVWMRTAESFGPDVFLPSLYQFVSTRLKPLPADK